MNKGKIIICAVTNDLSQDQRLHRICNTLHYNYTVRLVGRNQKNSIDLDSYPFETKRLAIWFERGFWFYVEYNIRLFFYLLNHKFDCINANDLDTLMACRLAAFVKRKKFVFDAHEIFTEVPELSNAPLKRRIWEAVGSIFLRKNQHNYTVNKSLSKHLKDKYKVPFEVIQNFPISERLSDKVQMQSPKRFVYQGVMNQGRGIENMISAVKQIPEAELILIGRGDIDQDIPALIEGYEHRISFVGFMPPHELRQLTKQCHIGFNILGRNSLNYYYSSANKYFDYIMSGIPCISMDFPEYQRANEQFETAILIPSYEVDYLVSAMQKLMSDNQLYQRLQSNCTKAKESFNWESQSELLLKFYEKVFS